MRKIICLSLVLFISAIIFAGVIFNRVFPLANALEVPTEDIISVTFSRDETETVLDENSISDFLKELSESKPTRKMSVNDYPGVECCTVTINTAYSRYIYFVYEENGRQYVEMPYVGIYKVDSEMLQMIS